MQTKEGHPVFERGNFLGRGGTNSVFKTRLYEQQEYALRAGDVSSAAFKDSIEYQFYYRAYDAGLTTQDSHVLLPITYQETLEVRSKVEVIFPLMDRGDLIAISEATPEYEKLAITSMLSPEDTKNLLLDLGTALDALHSPAVSTEHRDLKPWNILASKERGFFLADFGTSLLAEAPFRYDLRSYLEMMIWLLTTMMPRNYPAQEPGQAIPLPLQGEIQNIYGSEVLKILQQLEPQAYPRRVRDYQNVETTSLRQVGEQLVAALGLV